MATNPETKPLLGNDAPPPQAAPPPEHKQPPPPAPEGKSNPPPSLAAASAALGGGFETSLFGCFASIPGCLLSFFVGPVVAAATETDAADRPISWADCLVCCPNTYSTRQLIRKKYGIERAPWTDCATATFCPCCFVSQNAREISKRSGKDAVYYKIP